MTGERDRRDNRSREERTETYNVLSADYAHKRAMRIASAKLRDRIRALLAK